MHFFGLKRKKKDHLYMGEEKKKRKDPTQIFWVAVQELDWIGAKVFFKRPGLRISNPRWLYIYNLGYVLLVKSICTSGLYSYSTNSFRNLQNKATRSYLWNFWKHWTRLSVYCTPKEGSFQTFVRDYKCGFTLMGSVALLGKHIFTMTQLYTVKEYRVREYITYNEEMKGLERSKAGMDS